MEFNANITIANPVLTNGMSFYIRYRKKGTTTWFPYSPNPTTNNFTIGIFDEDIYEFEISTICSNGKVSKPVIAEYDFSNTNKPTINSVTLNANCKIEIDYTVNQIDLGTPEMQIATDPDFNNKIVNNIGYAYVNPYVTYVNFSSYAGTNVYIRVRTWNYPNGLEVISAWSNTSIFNVPVCTPSFYNHGVVMIDGSISNPKNLIPGIDICVTGNQFTHTISTNTNNLSVGTQLFVLNTTTPATIGNLFDNGLIGTNYNTNGIKWIRLIGSGVIYEVNPTTGIITNVASYTCP